MEAMLTAIPHVMRRIRIVCVILLFTNIFGGFRQASGTPYECPKKQEILPCENLRTSNGFLYHVPQMMRPDDCEHGWHFLENGTLIADSTPGGKTLKEIVVNVTPENLTVSICVNLQWRVDCADPVFICKINFTVLELNTFATPDSLRINKTCGGNNQDCNPNEDLYGLPAWWIVLIVIGILGVVGLSVIIWKGCVQPGKGPNAYRQNGVV